MSEAERDPSEPDAEVQETVSAPEPTAEQVSAPVAAPPEARSSGDTLQWQRLAALTAAISAAPDDPINYVLRGEVRLALGALDEAAEDFRRGLLLIAAIGETDWGYLHSLLADRAQEGLRRCLQT